MAARTRRRICRPGRSPEQAVAPLNSSRTGANLSSETINRRTWMAGSLSGLVSLGLGSLVADESNADLDIIDCHTHFYDPTRPEGIPWPQKGTPLYRTALPKHLRELKQFRRVTGTVIVEASDRVEDNAWLLELARNDPFVVGIVGHLDPAKP